MKKVENRIRIQDALDSIVHPKPLEQEISTSTKIIRYNQNGKSDLDRKKKFNDKETCAVQIISGQNKIFKVKAKRGGSLFNPFKTSPTYNLDIPDKTSNNLMFQLKEVNSKAFESYINFLTSGYDSHLFMAEREI